MLCLYPIHESFACGQCMNCRINKQRIWACRILLESYSHPHSIFVTLTYDDHHVPLTESGHTNLVKDDLRQFFRRFKKLTQHEQPYRHFAVGEYGTKTWRSHYHAVIFGGSLNHAHFVDRAWNNPKLLRNTGKNRGFITCSELNPDRAQYIAQYTTKKLTSPHSIGLDDRHPEFIMTSKERLAGGIGAPAAAWLAGMHRTREGRKQLAENADVWNTVRIDGKIWPLGPYMRNRIRQRLGIPAQADARALMFDRFNPLTGEIEQPQPLPLDYCPGKDYADELTMRKNHVNKEARKAIQPDLESKAAKRVRSSRRKTQTIQV